MARKEAGHIDYAGGFRFVWDGDGTGAIWRDNTEQDYAYEPEGYFRYAPVPVPGLEDALSVRGAVDGGAMTMATLDAAAAFVWGYHTARGDAAGRESLARKSSA